MRTQTTSPAHFQEGLDRRPALPLADDHPAWRLIGAWIAARQRGDADAIAPFVVKDAGRAALVLDDARALVAKGGGPLRTGAELDVTATARHDDDGRTLREVSITLTGKLEDPEPRTLVSRLSIVEVVREDDGDTEAWKIAALLDPQARVMLTDPAFLNMLKAQSQEQGAPTDGQP